MRWLIAIAASSLVLVASAIEPPKPAAGMPPAKQEPAKDEAAKASPAAPADEESAGETATTGDSPAPEEDEELPPLPADATPSGPPPARFNPTEKVRADFPVSFPIDI